MSTYFEAAQVFFFSVVFKLLTVNEKLYFSTDFEVHRNWMAITHSLPFSEWYKEARNVWTLDYPPFFAYFEYIISQVAVLVDPAMVNVDNINYASWHTIAFHRFSVMLLSDFLLAVGVWMILPPPKRILGLILALFSSSLFVVDHIHFQYNGMLLGLMLISAALVEREQFLLGAAAYMTLVWTKHIFLFCAPVYFVYFLTQYVSRASGLGKQVLRLVALVAVVVGVSAVALIPIIRTDQLGAMIERLFPFGRGLVHSYWAPNFWALYSGLDRFLGTIIRVLNGTSSPIGPSIMMILPPVSPFAALLCTLSGYVVLLTLLQRARKVPFIIWVGLGNAVAFAFGWHVHEKAVLMILFPLLMGGLAGGNGARLVSASKIWRLSVVANVAVMPLLFRRQEVVLNWVLLATGAVLQAYWLDIDLSDQKRWILAAVVPQFYGDFLHKHLLSNKLWFLPLALNSVASALLLTQSLFAVAGRIELADKPKAV